MKAPLIAVTLLSLAIASGCDRDRTDDQTAMADSTPATDTSAPADAAVTTDANANANSMSADGAAMPQDDTMPGGDAAQTGDALALGLLAAVDEHEIAAAKQAQEKGVTGDVLDYARMMEKEHGDNLAKTRSLGSPADGSDVQALKDKGAKELQTLDAASGKAYEKAYIDAMVKGHQEALDAIDNKMMPAATTDTVKQHLTDTRTHVAAHLDKAKAIAARQ
ncbi:DUF4142 domain-containing protein [Luteimonas notoginsengisoli]|uniref:DUF4142 domain-containing protein n=1 Tax=Luteimonas notoginsengisoli TaxID=1578200 RepID=A0ABV7UXY7_9GAMM